MFKLTGDRIDLAREFRDRPYGIHSPAPQAALEQLWLVNPNAKMLLVCTRPGREWTLAEIPGDPPRAHLRGDMVFESVEDAEWAVFKLRWQVLIGEALELDRESP